MNKVGKNIIIIKLGSLIVLSILFFSSCVYDEEFTYYNDQISTLNRRVTELQDAIDGKITTTINEDREARGALEANLQTINANQTAMRVEIDQLKGSLQDLSGRVEDNEHILKRTVEKDLSAQDSIKTEVAKLAQIQIKMQDLERMVRRQQEYLNLEPSSTRDEPISMVSEGDQEGNEGGPLIVGEEGSKTRELEFYDRSLALYKEEKFEQAIEGFNRFLYEFPKSDRADNSQFWIGECFMALKQFEQAILAYQEVIKKYPKGNKVPNAMLRQAVAFIEIKDTTSSRLLLKKVVKQYPDSSEAKIANTKLKNLK